MIGSLKENSTAICIKHGKNIIVYCLYRNCNDNGLCSQCFEKHSPTHVTLFRNVEDLSDFNLNEMTKKLYDNNFLKNSKLVNLKDRLKENVHSLTQELGEKISHYYYKKYMGIVNTKFNKFEENVINWVKHYDDNVVQIKKGDNYN
jgi:hypothetical protein